MTVSLIAIDEIMDNYPSDNYHFPQDNGESGKIKRDAYGNKDKVQRVKKGQAEN